MFPGDFSAQQRAYFALICNYRHHRYRQLGIRSPPNRCLLHSRCRRVSRMERLVYGQETFRCFSSRSFTHP